MATPNYGYEKRQKELAKKKKKEEKLKNRAERTSEQLEQDALDNPPTTDQTEQASSD